MNLHQLKAVIDYQVSEGRGELSFKGLMPNAVELDPVELELINGDQQLIPENPAAQSYFLLKFPQA
jgi:hypothetical protein